MADPPSHFFKFIQPGFKFNISIPESFWMKLNKNRCKKAILRRGCHEWPVDISDEGVFGNGWRQFVTENGVQEFDFIVFKHQGNMMFEFLVFDQSACERQYPNLFHEMKVEEVPLTESDSTYTHETSEKFKKRKRNNYLSQNENKSQVGDEDYFVTIMTPYCIKSSRLHVPNQFARSQGLITKRMPMKIGIMDEAQRKWPATLRKKGCDICLTDWREHKINNPIEAGDMCMFKLVKHGDLPIFTFSNIGKSHGYFVSTMKSNFKKSGLYLPAEFSVANGLKVGEMVLRDDKDRSWKVQLKKQGDKAHYIASGFSAFCVENELKEGDAFKFELLENKKNKPPVAKFSLIVDLNPSQEGSRPYFVGEMKSYNIEKPMLNLPYKFAKKNGLSNIEEMILKSVKDGRSWTVELNVRKNIHRYIGRGWKDFCIANGFKEGDKFKFELVFNAEKPVANIYLL